MPLRSREWQDGHNEVDSIGLDHVSLGEFALSSISPYLEIHNRGRPQGHGWPECIGSLFVVIIAQPEEIEQGVEGSAPIRHNRRRLYRVVGQVILEFVNELRSYRCVVVRTILIMYTSVPSARTYLGEYECCHSGSNA